MIKLLENDKIFYLLFFLPLMGTAFLGYAISVLFIALCVFSRKSIIITPYGLIAFVFYILIVLLKIFQTSNTSLVSVITRFYLGLGPILLYLYYSRIKVDVNLLVVLLSSEIIGEAFLINFFISPSLLPNYPTEIHFGGFDATDVIGYQRPYSIGINATVTSTILCMLLAYRELQCKNGGERNVKVDIISTLAVLALASGTGLLLFGVYLLYRFSGALNIKNTLLFGGLLIIVVLVLNSEFMGESIASHFSKEYIQFIIDYKKDLYKEYFALFNNKFMGINFYNMEPLTHGDTAFVEFLLSFGYIGIAYFSFLVLPFINRKNWCPILIGLIGAFHYGGIFSLPGQMIMAYAMLLNNCTMDYYFKPRKG